MSESLLLSHLSLSLGFFSFFVFIVIVRKGLNAADHSEAIASKPAQIAICSLSIIGVFAAARVIGVDTTNASAYAFIGGSLAGLGLGHAAEPRRPKSKS